MNTDCFDPLKFILAFFVVAIHTGINQEYPFMLYFTGLAVPMFFVMSGFLVGNRINGMTKKEADGYLAKNFARNGKMYVKWSLIYLPLTIYGFATGEESLPIRLHSVVRGWLFVGENYMSWPLWYLLALVVAILLIRYSYRVLSIEMTFVVSIVLYVIGCFIEKELNSPTCSSPIVVSFLKYYHLLFKNTRNGIFVGMFLVTSGIMMHKYYSLLENRKRMTTLLTLILLALHLCDVPYTSIMLVPCALFSLMQAKYNLQHGYLMRKLSTLIYFTHMYVVFSLGILFPSFSPLILFMYACVGSLVFSCLIFLARKRKSFDRL